MKHHPSCKPSDRDLVWHCNQCGLNESASEVEQEVEALRKALRQINEEGDIEKIWRIASNALGITKS
jgi:hypothetical protein